MRSVIAARAAALSDRDPRRVDDLLDGKIGTKAKTQAKTLQHRPGTVRAALIDSPVRSANMEVSS